MKKINYYKLLMIPALVILALLTLRCTPRESQVDSKKVAEEKNREKFTTKTARQDAEFVTDAVASGLAQVRLAELALEKSRDEEVKQVAAHIKTDYTALLNELSAYSARHVITLPHTETEDVRKRILKLRNETGQFNKKWCDEVLSLHKTSIERLEKNPANVSDPELQQWIAQTLPRLRTNLDRVSACHNRVK
ncbi:MAG TPA: DUF4142 domain-containing protein [Cyclobacteriaceae bacterium]|nr:DUF4142 domain-containing protein [Cyclobacteriaceae bacterium]